MQLKSLRMLLAVCESGSFGAAALRLHTVQSNVTAHIKKLEDELGAQLLERSAPVRATAAGQQLLPHAQRLLQLHDETCNLFASTAAPSGALRIGAMETTAALRLPPVLVQLHQAWPQLDLQLHTGPSIELLERLGQGQLDCALAVGPPQPSRWFARPLFAEELVLVSAAPLPDLPTPTQLQQTPFLAFRQGCSYRQRVELLLASQGVHAVRIMELGSLDAILGCVAAGMGLALLPQAVVQAQQHRFGVHTLVLPEPLRTRVGRLDTWFVAGAPSGWSIALRAFAAQLQVAPDEAAQHAVSP